MQWRCFAPKPYGSAFFGRTVPEVVFFGGCEKGTTGLDRTVARLNIEHYRKKLAEETDPDRRATLLRLIAEEEAKSIAAERQKSSDKNRP